mmetsp:Transcript_8032/g.17273  ORF Transcript_8032/g.17273 Transcript_8032/m.17273 type:complete len:164 (-) Transcript_8032:1217-1708(-)
MRTGESAVLEGRGVLDDVGSPRSDCSGIMSKNGLRSNFNAVQSVGVFSACDSTPTLGVTENDGNAWSTISEALRSSAPADIDGFSFVAGNCIKFLNRQHYNDSAVSALRLVQLLESYARMAADIANSESLQENKDYIFTRVFIEIQTLTHDVRHSSIFRTVCA